MTRSEARIEAFKLIFQITAHKESYPEVVILFQEENPQLKKTDKKQYNYIVNTANGVFDNMSEIDESICRNLNKEWTMERLSKVTLAILRLAVYELKFADDIPENVSINEAIEIAKVYDIDDAPSFINGVLGGIAKEK